MKEINPKIAEHLRTYYADTPNVVLAESMGCSRASVNNYARRLGLQKSPEYIAQLAKEHGKMKKGTGKKRDIPKVTNLRNPDFKYTRYIALKKEGKGRMECAMLLGVSLQTIDRIEKNIAYYGNEENTIL